MEMETGVIKVLYRDASVQRIATLGPKVCKYYLHWDIWIFWSVSCSEFGVQELGFGLRALVDTASLRFLHMITAFLRMRHRKMLRILKRSERTSILMMTWIADYCGTSIVHGRFKGHILLAAVKRVATHTIYVCSRNIYIYIYIELIL